MKDNKKRIRFWGIVCLIFFSLGIGGIISYNKGYGEKGRAKVKLTPIVEAFNKLDQVLRFGDLKAKVSGTKILVTYINPNNKKDKFYYELKKDGDMYYIESTFNDTNGKFIAKQMIDAVYKKDGIPSSIYDFFDFESFTEGTLKDGVKLTSNLISINITDNILLGLKGKIKSKDENKYFSEEELSYIVSELKEQKKASKELDNIKLYVVEEEGDYRAYITFNESVKERSLISLGYLIKLLNKTTYDTLEMNNEIPLFKEDSPLYSINTNSKLTDVAFFNEDDIVCELIIKK